MPTTWLVPLSDVAFTEAEVDAVAAVYRGGWLSQGPRVAAFERAFAELVGSREAIAVANGTAALQLICTALNLGPGQEVVLPSLTFAATAAVVVHAGARAVFADIADVHRPWLSTEAAAAVLTARTRAIINVSYGGHPGESDALLALAGQHRLSLIEDAAHALGTRVGARAAGTIGRAGAFSFFANKNMPLGEGGMIVTDDAEMAARMRRLRSHGLTSDTWARHAGGDAEYDVLEPGFNVRLDEARAALGLLRLARLASDNARRAARARAYADALAAIDGIEPAITDEPGVENAWHIYPVLLDPEIDRRAVRSSMAAAGVQTSVHYPPLHLTSAYFDEGNPRFPRTEDYARRTMTLPLFPHMSDDQHSRVLDAVASAVQGARAGLTGKS